MRVAILLAAGASKRMGSPKQLVEIDGVPLVKHVFDAVSASSDVTLVVLGAHSEEIRARLPGAACVINEDWADGMGRSIAAGVDAAQALEPSSILIATCDQPLLTSDDYASLFAALEASEWDAVAAKYDGILGVPAVFDARLIETLSGLDNDRGARAVLRSSDWSVGHVDLPAAALDLDTKDDLKHLNETRNGVVRG